MRPLGRSDLGLLAAAIAGGLLFFASLDDLWPLAETRLLVPPAALEDEARSLLAARGEDLAGYRAATSLDVDTPALDYVERAFGRDESQRLLASVPLVTYSVRLKKGGDRRAYLVTLHPEKGVVGWIRSIEDDEPGPRVTVEAARALATQALSGSLGLDVAVWDETSQAIEEKPSRRDHAFLFERSVSDDPELRERATVLVAGDRVVVARRDVVVPGAAAREARAREGPQRGLEAVGILLTGVAAVAAFAIFLLRLQKGTARLGPAGVWIAVVAAAQLGALLLQSSRLFDAWEPLWPRWVSTLRFLLFQSAGLAWVVVVLLAFAVAGDALDRESGARRGESLRQLGRGRFASEAVGLASMRGFLVGLLCGGILAGSVRLLDLVVGVEVSIQPRGFFFYALNASSPALSTILFFLTVALAEELGYRFFGGSWILSLTKRPWAAILVPAVLYGLTHTRMDFLPPAEPFWGRALVMTLVGCVWGWAFLRYDALTVVLSHYTADLFVFHWPRLGSGETGPMVGAALTVLVPLIPAACWAVSRLSRRREKERTMDASTWR
jgi:hypothetical protein